MSATSASADSLYWNGTVSTDWTDAGNWTNSGGAAHAPQAGDSVTVQGATTAIIYNNLGSALPAIDDLTVGNTSDGSLEIDNALTSTSAVLGTSASASGKVTLSGSLGNWTNGDLSVGVAGIGTLVVTAGAQYNGTGSTAVGADAGSSGSISVSGGGSYFQTSGAFIIGDQGSGSFEVVTGAAADSDDVILGNVSGASGSATISGSGSAWTIANLLTVGEDGTGTVNVATGASLSAATTVIGDGADSNGSALTVSGSGSSFDTSGQLTVGSSGDASLNVYSGATAGSGNAIIGQDANGTVNVAGLGSLWTSGDLTIGDNSGGSGTLAISGAGEVDSDLTTLGSANGSSGTVNVNGSGSLWNVSNTLTVGDAGTGNINITNGSSLDTQDTILGASSSGEGNVLVTGGGSNWTSSGALTVGEAGTGNLSVTLGAALDAGNITVGDLTGSTGTVTVSGDGSTISSSGTVTVGASGDGTLTVSGGGTLSANTLDIATDAGSSGTVNFGAAFGDTAGGVGTIDVDTIHFGSGDGTLVFNFGGSYTLTAAIDGNGEIDLAAGALTLTGDSSNFTGVTTLYGGSLTVDGTLGGSIVLDGGTLAGSGTIGSASFGSGSTVSAGGSGSVGTLTVNGNASFSTGATYAVDLSSSSSDTIAVTGTATLNGGTVSVGKGSGLTNYQTYTILTASGGRSGSFDSVSASYTFLAASLGYTATDVTLTLERNGVSFSSVGATHNERATGAAIDSINGGKLYSSILSLDADEARSAFNQLAGAVHASIAAANFDESRFVSNIAVDRLRSAFGGVGAATGTVYVLGGPTPADHSALAYGSADSSSSTPAARAAAAILADPDTARAVAWGQAYGGWGRNSGDSNAAGLTSSTAGIVLGMDAPLGDTTWRMGVLTGYSHDNYRQGDDASSADSDGYDIGVYGGNRWGPVSLRFGAIYGRKDVSSRRSVDYDDFDETLSADYVAQTAQAFGEVGYAMKAGAVDLEPFANLAYVHLHNNAFTENGGAAALTSDATDAGVTYTTLGLHAATDASFGDVRATAHGTLGWRHGFGDLQTASTFSFAGSDQFTTYGDVVAADSMIIEAGLDIAVSPLSTIGLTYNGQYGGGSLSQTIKLGLAVRF